MWTFLLNHFFQEPVESFTDHLANPHFNVDDLTCLRYECGVSWLRTYQCNLRRENKEGSDIQKNRSQCQQGQCMRQVGL